LSPNTSRWGLRCRSTWSGSRASRGRREPSWREGRWARIAGELGVRSRTGDIAGGAHDVASARGAHAIFFPSIVLSVFPEGKEGVDALVRQQVKGGIATSARVLVYTASNQEFQY
jgi:hypothetical protein